MPFDCRVERHFVEFIKRGKGVDELIIDHGQRTTDRLTT